MTDWEIQREPVSVFITTAGKAEPAMMGKLRVSLRAELMGATEKDMREVIDTRELRVCVASAATGMDAVAHDASTALVTAADAKMTAQRAEMKFDSVEASAKALHSLANMLLERVVQLEHRLALLETPPVLSQASREALVEPGSFS